MVKILLLLIAKDSCLEMSFITSLRFSGRPALRLRVSSNDSWRKFAPLSDFPTSHVAGHGF